MRIRDLGYAPGSYPTGSSNSLLDVPGVGIAQLTVPTDSQDQKISDRPERPGPRKGATVLLPRPATDIFTPCHAAVHVHNGNGELTGRAPIHDWGFTNTPIVLTNSCSVGVCFDGIWDYILKLHDQRQTSLRDMARNYGTPVVAETADWWINSRVRDTRIDAVDLAKTFAEVKTLEEGGRVLEGSYGGGAGMTCHEYKGGTGTASRIVGGGYGGEQYTIGVLAQTNYGHQLDLQIAGIPVGKILAKEKIARIEGPKKSEVAAGRTDAGSLLVIIFTDAPLLPHQLERLARHATVGTAQVGTYGVGRTFSGDIFLALSTAEHPKEQLAGKESKIGKTIETYSVDVIKNESIDALFEATAEATEEAILNSMVGARDGMVCMDGSEIEGLPVERVRELLKQYEYPV